MSLCWVVSDSGRLTAGGHHQRSRIADL